MSLLKQLRNLKNKYIGNKMTIYCKVDGIQFEPKESRVYCSLGCAIKDNGEYDDNQCLKINHMFKWNNKIIEGHTSTSRRNLWGIEYGNLEANMWLTAIKKNCDVICMNIDHFKAMDRKQILKNNGMKSGTSEVRARHSESMKQFWATLFLSFLRTELPRLQMSVLPSCSNSL